MTIRRGREVKREKNEHDFIKSFSFGSTTGCAPCSYLLFLLSFFPSSPPLPFPRGSSMQLRLVIGFYVRRFSVCHMQFRSLSCTPSSHAIFFFLKVQPLAAARPSLSSFLVLPVHSLRVSVNVLLDVVTKVLCRARLDLPSVWKTFSSPLLEDMSQAFLGLRCSSSSSRSSPMASMSFLLVSWRWDCGQFCCCFVGRLWD
jgi:hypothetical protein